MPKHVAQLAIAALVALAAGAYADPPPARPCPPAQSDAAGDARPVALPTAELPTPTQIAQRYVAVGERLWAHPADNLWARFRRIRIQDALTTQQSRTETARLLAEIDRSLGHP